ncbi:MAG: ATP F0F1 synthase subunit B, partial [Rhodobacteraceae bacterium]|nr:ATP F0F1 synthase subunit B [Paracoccaceae bacterium]
MPRLIVCLVLMLGAAPLHAASGPFLSLGNTDFVVLISFILFIAAMIRFRAPHFVGKLLDNQIAGIRERIEGAEALQDEARTLLAELEGRQSEATAHAETIV